MFSFIPLSPFHFFFLTTFFIAVIFSQGFQGIAGERGADGPPGSLVCQIVTLWLCHLKDRGIETNFLRVEAARQQIWR